MTTAGRVRWQVPLAGPALGSNQHSPLAVGAIAVFAQGDILYGLRLTDGHQVWSSVTSQEIVGMWRWQGLVIVLTDSAGGWPVLTGLNASTGQAHWTKVIPVGVEESYPTADGGLAILRGDNALEVVDLSTGRVRWTRPDGYAPNSSQSYPSPMAAVGGTVLFGVNGKLTSYDDRTGQIRWTEAPMPIQLANDLGELSLHAAAGLIYVTGLMQKGAPGQTTQVLVGISAADGRVKWQIVPNSPDTLVFYNAGLISVTSSSGRTWQDEVDPATGRVRWQVAARRYVIATPRGIVTVSGTGGTRQISVLDTLTGQTRWTVGLARLNLGWQRQAPTAPVFPAGSLLVVPAARLAGPDLIAAFRMSDGHRAWQVTIPEPVAAPPSVAPGGMLVYAADLRLPP